MSSSILLSDNGASSGSAGLKSTAGNDGVLILQTTTSGGTATNAIYVDTSQQVGVNKTPSAGGGALQVGFDSSANAAVRIQTTNASTAGELLNFINSSNSTAGKVIYGTSQTSVVYQTTTAGQSTGAVLQNSGIAFPASQVASSDANTLDDYEEGNWTPVIGGSSGASGQAYSAQNGNYIKIGSSVILTGFVQLTTKGTFSGSYVCISGLPFVSSGADWQISVGYYGGLATSKVYIGGYTSGNLLVLTGKSAASSELTVGGLVQSDIQNTTYIAFTVSYKATA